MVPAVVQRNIFIGIYTLTISSMPQQCCPSYSIISKTGHSACKDTSRKQRVSAGVHKVLTSLE